MRARMTIAALICQHLCKEKSMCVKDKHKLPPQTAYSAQRQRRRPLHLPLTAPMVLILKRALVQIFTFAYWKKGKAKLKLVGLRSDFVQASASQRIKCVDSKVEFRNERHNHAGRCQIHDSLFTLDNQRLYHTWKMWLLQLTKRMFFFLSFTFTRLVFIRLGVDTCFNSCRNWFGNKTCHCQSLIYTAIQQEHLELLPLNWWIPNADPCKSVFKANSCHILCWDFGQRVLELQKGKKNSKVIFVLFLCLFNPSQN